MTAHYLGHQHGRHRHAARDHRLDHARGRRIPEAIYSDPVPLERLTAAIWTRPRWNATMRADPSSYGANNFRAGERILT
jgi:hypothetical protein